MFFSLYKVLFVTIEMRHAPFYGWIKDLSAPDPTNLFTLFGLLHFDPTQLPLFGHYLALGVWPIIMGITMWFQMKLNPTPPDPTQQMIFDLDAADLHLHAGGLPGGAGDLLGLEQHAVGAAAELHHAPQRREGGTVRQSEGDVRAEEGRIEDLTERAYCIAAGAATRHARVSTGIHVLTGTQWFETCDERTRLARHDGTAIGSLRMTTEPDAKLIEQGRKLFAGDWQFFWASPSIEALPPMAGIEVAFAGRSNVGKSSLINALTGRNALARTSHTPGRTQELIFFEGPDECRLPAGRHARLRLRLRAEGQGRVMDRADPQIPARPQQSGAGLCADRCPPWPQGGRSRGARRRSTNRP